MEKKMENDMETRVKEGIMGVLVYTPSFPFNNPIRLLYIGPYITPL